jgi:hypothetical protein
MTTEPLACTLTADQLRMSADQLLPGLAASSQTAEWLPDGLRLTFDATDGLLTHIADVIERERGCCSFLRFTLGVAPSQGPVTLDVTGPPGTRAVLEDAVEVLPEAR